MSYSHIFGIPALAAFTLSAAAISQETPPQPPADPLFTMFMSGDALVANQHGTPISSEMMRQSRAMFLSMTGREVQAIEVFQQAETNEQRAPLFASHEGETELVQALDYIEQVAQNHDVIVLNEAHHVEQHRWFLYLLLQRLAPHGYTNLSLEALHNDGLGNPASNITHRSGILMSSPGLSSSAQLIQSLGGAVFAHERTGQQHQNEIDREVAQAQNVLNTLSRNPGQKLIVYVGYDHASERSDMMAHKLRELGGIDPLTIDQVWGNRGGNHLTVASTMRDHAIVPLVSGNPLRPRGHGMDMLVVHPSFEETADRPDWYVRQVGKRLVSLDQSELPTDRPLLLEAYPVGHEDGSIPADRTIMETDSPRSLALFPGNYVVRVRSESTSLEIPVTVAN